MYRRGKGMIAELGGLDAARRQLADVEVIAASDVEYPLLGPWGTARVFAPQKGADMATVAVLEGRLAAWAIELDAAAGRGERRAGRMPPVVSGLGCSRLAAGTSRVRQSSQSTRILPTTLPMRS